MPLCLIRGLDVADFPNYKYRPRRKKRDGQKGATNNNNNNINNNRSNGASPGVEKTEPLEEKLEKTENMSYSTATPPLFDSGSPLVSDAMSRSFNTIPTPESSPSSCTSDVFHHSAFQPGGLHSPMSDLRTYTLPTPEVSPLEPGPRPLDYQTYGCLPHPDRFSFDGGSLSGYGPHGGCLTMEQVPYPTHHWPKAEHYPEHYQLAVPALEAVHHTSHFQSRDLIGESGDSLSSTLAGLRENYYDYNMSKQPEHGEI